MIRFEFWEIEQAMQDLDGLGLTDADIAGLVSYRRAVGYWRSDLASGLVYWSRALFDIYAIAFTEGPVNLTAAYAKVHRDDLDFMLELIERAASEKTGFHFVLRLKTCGEGYKYIRSVGLYRTTADGREELFGNVEEVHHNMRLIGVFDNPSATA